MKSLLSKNSLKLLHVLSSDKTLYAFDFDGTLAKLVAIPTAAKLSATTEKLLMKLAKLVPVAIVSGRSVQDLESKIRFPVAYLIGNHGLEGISVSKTALKRAKDACRAWVKQIGLTRLDPGVEVEPKELSISIHYRRARNQKLAKQQLDKMIAGLEPTPRVIGGKFVINLLPEGAPHKGIAVQELMKLTQSKNAFFAGDDITDDDVFNLEDPNIFGLRVGVKRGSKAGYYIRTQSEMNSVLKKLIEFHSI